MKSLYSTVNVMRILEHIQTRDRQKKSHYSVVIAGGITGIIALVWITTLPARLGETISLNDTSEGFEQPTQVTEKKGIGSFFSDTRSQLGNIFQSNKEAMQEAKQTLKENSSFDELSPQKQQASITNSVSDETLTSGEANATSRDPLTSTSSESVSPSSTTTPTPSSTGVDVPRIILIGTTTNHSSE